jgi:hypothetical protein
MRNRKQILGANYMKLDRGPMSDAWKLNYAGWVFFVERTELEIVSTRKEFDALKEIGLNVALKRSGKIVDLFEVKQS